MRRRLSIQTSLYQFNESGGLTRPLEIGCAAFATELVKDFHHRRHSCPFSVVEVPSKGRSAELELELGVWCRFDV